jgi:hypothetical protein
MAVLQNCGKNIQYFYVSPQGNDSNPGSEIQPFQTITRAQTAVQEYRSLSTAGLTR